MSKIIAMLDGGLGNKLNCLFSSVYISKLYNKTLHINNVRSNFSDFDLRKLFNIPYEYTEYTSTELDSKIPSDIPIFLHKEHFKYNRKKFNLSSLNSSYNDFIYLTDRLRAGENNLEDIINHISINQDILQNVNKFVLENNIDEKTLGIHIRCTDSSERSENISQSTSLIKAKQNKKIFVCTDEKEIKNIISEYDNIITYPVKDFVEKFNKNLDWRGSITDSDNRKWNYNVSRSETSTIEAFVELLILSKTNIITKNKSTFLSWATRYKKYNFCT